MPFFADREAAVEAPGDRIGSRAGGASESLLGAVGRGLLRAIKQPSASLILRVRLQNAGVPLAVVEDEGSSREIARRNLSFFGRLIAAGTCNAWVIVQV